MVLVIQHLAYLLLRYDEVQRKVHQSGQCKFQTEQFYKSSCQGRFFTKILFFKPESLKLVSEVLGFMFFNWDENIVLGEFVLPFLPQDTQLPTESTIPKTTHRILKLTRTENVIKNVRCFWDEFFC
jgi:hypothetical protein